MKTLLEKAKETKTSYKAIRITEEHIELAVAWCEGEIQLTQVTHALGIAKSSGGNTLYRIAVFLREGFRRGLIQSRSPQEK